MDNIFDKLRDGFNNDDEIVDLEDLDVKLYPPAFSDHCVEITLGTNYGVLSVRFTIICHLTNNELNSSYIKLFNELTDYHVFIKDHTTNDELLYTSDGKFKIMINEQHDPPHAKYNEVVKLTEALTQKIIKHYKLTIEDKLAKHKRFA